MMKSYIVSLIDIFFRDARPPWNDEFPKFYFETTNNSNYFTINLVATNLTEVEYCKSGFAFFSRF